MYIDQLRCRNCYRGLILVLNHMFFFYLCMIFFPFNSLYKQFIICWAGDNSWKQLKKLHSFHPLAESHVKIYKINAHALFWMKGCVCFIIIKIILCKYIHISNGKIIYGICAKWDVVPLFISSHCLSTKACNVWYLVSKN